MPQYHVTATFSTGYGANITNLKHRHHLIDAPDKTSAINAIRRRNNYNNGQLKGWTLVARKWMGAKLPKSTIVEDPA